MIDFKRDILALVADDFAAMDTLINTGINSKVPLVLQVSQHVVSAGGKRMRPLMTLLAAHACAPLTPTVSDDIIMAAAIIEMLHTATLVHDDVVDESNLRRGIPTANATWSNPTAVLVGDFLIARSFDLLVDIGYMPLLKEFSMGTCEIAEGEVLQLQYQHNPDTTEDIYLQIIHGKTSRLFELATTSAAMLSRSEKYRVGLTAFAGHFGNAFQIIDDILDYTSDADTLGKNIGDDLMEGKPTLPLIAAMRLTTGADRDLIRTSIQTGGLQDIDRVIALVYDSGALAYCRQRAAEETSQAINALSILPDSKYRTALQHLAQLALDRLN